MTDGPMRLRSGAGLVAAGGVLALVAPVAGAIGVSIAILLVLLLGHRRDPVTIVGAVFVLFVAVPTRFSFVGFGPLTPGMLLASLALLWWLWAGASHRAPLDRGRNPIHVLVVVLLVGAAVGFATMFTHPVTSEQFVNAHRSPGILLMFLGLTLIVTDGVQSRRRLDDLLEILVLCAGALAVCGLIEQLTGQRMFTGARLPLLTENPSQLTISERNGFLRVAGTAKHPIEFAVVLAAMLPIGLHLSIHGRPAFRPTARCLTVLMAVALPLAISRSGVIGAAVGVLVLSLGWSWRRRAVVAIGSLAAVTALAIAIPQLMDTMEGLFLNVGDDTSIAARTRDYDVLDGVLTESPWFGRGLGEYNVVDYEVFDNQYLATIVDGGYVGLGIQLGAFLVPILLAWHVSRVRFDAATRHLAQAAAASLTVLMVTWAFFDGGGYRIATALVFTLTGVVGALWRLEHRDRDPALDRLAGAVREPVHAWGVPPARDAKRPVRHWGRAPGSPPAGPPPEPEPEPVAVPVSVVVPAHDEAAVIDRFLSTLLADARPGELDVVVACNGCSDDTAQLARRYPVRVLELETASKHAALRAGDELAHHFPRFYVDADVRLSTRSLRTTAWVLAEDQALAAAPRLDLDLRGCRPAVRAYYAVWRRLPYCTGDLVGSGVYGVSEAGHRRLGELPDLIADDLWFRNHFEPGERVSVRSARFVQHPPRDLRSLLRVRTRQHLGNLEYTSRFGDAGAGDGRGAYLRGLLSPGALPGAPLYLALNALARRRARRRWRAGALHWDADVSSRLRSAT